MISISVDKTLADRFVAEFPVKMGTEWEVFRDRVGFKLEAASKRAAPAITGNLRRNIMYSDNAVAGFMNGVNAGELSAHARYSKYVHGAPFYENKMRRRETPFITNAISSSSSFIRTESRAMMRRVVK